MKKIMVLGLAVAVSAGAGIWFADRYGSGMEMNPAEGEPGHKHVPVKKTDPEGKVYYTCAMHRQVRSDEPGNCPICGMQLIKKREPVAGVEDSADDTIDIVSIDPRVVQNLGIRTAPVERGTVTEEVRVSGSVMANENRIEVVQTRSAGWVERLHVRAVNDPVRRGQVLAEIYSPDLYAAQQEFVLAARARDESLINASRQRLVSLGLGAAQIARLEESGEAQRRVTYYSPLDGVVTELGVREGAQLSPGMSLFTLVDLSKVWVIAEVPESQASRLARGAAVEARVPALPGRVFQGRVDYVYPEVSAETRTVRIRALLDNAGLSLKPGMFAEVLLSRGKPRTGLLVPSEAVIRTGTRATVIVAEGEGRFRPVLVTPGAEHEGRTEILSGLEEGQQIVASGQFLIDSEANLRGALNRLAPPDSPPERMEQNR